MPSLRSPRHEAFCQAFVTSGNASAAYRESGGNGKNADVMADQLMGTNGVAGRIAELKAEAGRQCRLSRRKVMDFLCDVIETAAGRVHKTDKLCQSFKDTDDIHEIRMPDKLSAISQLSRMCGWDSPGKVELGASNDLTELLKRLRGSG